MKRIFALLLAAFLLLSMTGCSAKTLLDKVSTAVSGAEDKVSDLTSFLSGELEDFDKKYTEDPATELVYEILSSEKQIFTFCDKALLQIIWNTLRSVTIGAETEYDSSVYDRCFTFSTESGKTAEVRFNGTDALISGDKCFTIVDDNGIFTLMNTIGAAPAAEYDPKDIIVIGEKGGHKSRRGKDDDAPVVQLTEDDIDAMNDGKALFVYNDYGYISTLVGRYYDKKINDYEDAVESLRGIQGIIGLGAGSEFFCVYGQTDDDGYTYYTFQQRYGGYTLRNATLRVIVGPDGYAAGLSSSFTPNVGVSEDTGTISAQEAEEIVRNLFSDFDLTFYTESTSRLAVTFNNVTYNCWAVYTNNPDEGISFEMPYMEHYVQTDGTYLTLIPTSSLNTSNAEAFKTEAYFEPMVPESYSRIITLGDGTTRNVTVTISKNKNDGLYYLCDPERMIIVGDYYSFAYQNTLNFLTGKSGDDWNDNYLMAYANYCAAYDFYAQRGLHSVDGFGTPILVTVGYCDADGKPVSNACYFGNNSGWACFAVSDINIYSMALDCVCHEFTHGVTKQSMQGSAYYNETGALNEAYSDIMGNLCEMSTGFTDDESWLLLETTGEVMRSMSDPNRYQQPAFVGDVYYVPTILNPHSSVNDLGGVHANNTLISGLACALDKAGMSYDEQISLWLTSIELLTPLADYDDLHAALLFSSRINGLLDYGAVINSYYEDCGLNAVRAESYLEAKRAGFGRINFTVDEKLASMTVFAQYYNSNFQLVTEAYPDENGVVSVLVPEGEYAALFGIYYNGSVTPFVFTENGWISGNSGPMLFSVKDGKTSVINDISLADPDTGGTEQTPQPPPPPENDGTTLKLVNYQGRHFTMLVPSGWKVEEARAGEYLWVRIYDPAEPSRQAFYYSYLEPLLKNQEAKNMYALTDYTGFFKYAPVLWPRHSEGLLMIWDDCIQYQKLFGASSFTKLYNIVPQQTEYFTGPLTPYGAIESTCAATCSSESGKDCIIVISSAIYDAYTQYISGVDTGYLAILNLYGILMPASETDALYSDLLTCLNSFRQEEGYVNGSMNSGGTVSSVPMLGMNAAAAESGADGLAGMEDSFVQP